MNIFPQQAIPFSEKDKAWLEANVRYFVELSAIRNDYEMELQYKAAEGILNKDNYKYVLNPFNSTDENLKNYPAQLRNYDFIIPIIKYFLGDKSKRPSQYEVIVTNDDAPSRFKEAQQDKVRAWVAQSFINQANQGGFKTGVPSQEIPELKVILEEHEQNYNDSRAIFGQQALDYLKYNLELDEKLQKAMYHYLVSGYVITYKEVQFNDVHYEIVHPLEVRWGHTNTDFIEDADWVVRRRKVSVNTLVDYVRNKMFKNNLEGLTADEVIKQLEDLGRGPGMPNGTLVSIGNNERMDSKGDSYFDPNSGEIDWWQGQWRSLRKIGILTYRDELGMIQSTQVDEDYTLNKEAGDIEIEWEWISQYWSFNKVGENLIFGCEPIEDQRSEMNNISKCKNSFNGRKDKFPSTVKTLMPYQALYNIYHFRGELTLARNKDKIMLMPKGLLPTGWSPEKAMYFAEATSIMWFDETKPNAAQILNAIRGIDLGLGNYVAEMRALLQSIKEEAMDAVGVNRQRMGEVMASDGKATTDSAIYQSTLMSEEFYRSFEQFEERELQGLVDLSRVAWIDGKKGMYVTSDGQRAFFEVDPELHLGTEYGIFIKKNAVEMEKLKLAKQLAFGMVQKGSAKTSQVLEIIGGNNFAKIKSIIKKAEAIEDHIKQQMEQAAQESQKYVADTTKQVADAKNQVDIYKADKQYAAAVDSAIIKVQGDLYNTQLQGGSQSSTEDNGTAMLQDQHNKVLSGIDQSKLNKFRLDLDNMKEANSARLKEDELRLKEKQIDTNYKISKENKNRYDR